MSAIYHLVVEPELLAGLGPTHYEPARLAEDGFVHCCGEREAALAVAHDYFGAARAPVFLLELEPRRLDARLVFEAPAPLPGAPTAHLASAEKFPHVYGPIALRAVTGAARLVRDGRGGFRWPERFAPLGESLGGVLAERLAAGEARGLEALRGCVASHSRALRKASARVVLDLGAALVESGAPGSRVLGSELVLHHPRALTEIRVRDVRRLAGTLASWSDVDVFACMISGQAFRDGRLSEKEILRWARSRDRWWRRARAGEHRAPQREGAGRARRGRAHPARVPRSPRRPRRHGREGAVVGAARLVRARPRGGAPLPRRPRKRARAASAARSPEQAEDGAEERMSETEYEGGCLCGAVRFRAAGPASNATLCHCTSCRRAAGAPVVAWLTFAAPRFAFTRGDPVRYRSSPLVVRSFCGRCGTQSWLHAGR